MSSLAQLDSTQPVGDGRCMRPLATVRVGCGRGVLGHCLTGAVAVLAIAPTTALGAEVGTLGSPARLQFDAGALERNSIRISRSSNTYTFEEVRPDGPTVADRSSACTQATARRVVCSFLAERIDVFLDDLDDILTTSESTVLPRLLVNAGTGDDDVRAGSGNDRVDGGTGGDKLLGRGGNDELIGGLGIDRLDIEQGDSVENAGVDSYSGGSGDDSIGARDGVAETLFGGDNTFLGDFAESDLRDHESGVVDGFERQDIGAIRESPNVRLRGRVSRSGLVRLRLACPLAVPLGCRGRLTLNAVSARLRSRGRLARRAYRRIAPGASRRVRIRLRGRTLQRARRYRRVRVTSVEQGQHGPKTTIVTLRVPRAGS